MSKLLLVDDDIDVLSVNKKYFTKEGYEVKVASNAITAIKLLKTFSADCIILDVMMPGLNGFDACKQIRTITNSPIIFLTGCSNEKDTINGLLIGGDDYIIKPYSLKELSARIQVQIRRTSKAYEDSTTISCPPLFIDLVGHKALFNDEDIPLSNREYELLYLLATKPNCTVTFEDIGIAMWGTYSETDRRTIMVTASRLRKKLEDYIGLSEYIETVWSKGYKLIVKSQH
ncbi:response regulator transcription factor [Anaerosporobacter sp.]